MEYNLLFYYILTFNSLYKLIPTGLRYCLQQRNEEEENY